MNIAVALGLFTIVLDYIAFLDRVTVRSLFTGNILLSRSNLRPGDFIQMRNIVRVFSHTYIPRTYIHTLFLWNCDPTRVMASSFLMFLDHTHNDAPQSVGLLWTSDQLVAETST
jgi:hypothetical protein